MEEEHQEEREEEVLNEEQEALLSNRIYNLFDELPDFVVGIAIKLNDDNIIFINKI